LEAHSENETWVAATAVSGRGWGEEERRKKEKRVRTGYGFLRKGI
jgi:hypothetical protein